MSSSIQMHDKMQGSCFPGHWLMMLDIYFDISFKIADGAFFCLLRFPFNNLDKPLSLMIYNMKAQIDHTSNN